MVVVRSLGTVAYERAWHDMREFTGRRERETADEIWLLTHPPVYTLGQAGRREHLRSPGGVPVVQVDRGGQVTYHGPGQVVVYVLLDLRRAGLGVRGLVGLLERCVIDVLREAGVEGEAREDAPGVYVAGAKIAALGLRVRNGCSYHGLSLNVNTDLEPFSRIDPCGYPGLRVTRLSDLGVTWTVEEVGERLAGGIVRALGQAPVYR